jgi:hypothetical protein
MCCGHKKIREEDTNKNRRKKMREMRKEMKMREEEGKKAGMCSAGCGPNGK